MSLSFTQMHADLQGSILFDDTGLCEPDLKVRLASVEKNMAKEDFEAAVTCELRQNKSVGSFEFKNIHFASYEVS